MAGRLPTLGLFVFFLKVVLFLSVEPVKAARQHCRLKPRDQTDFHTPGGGAAPSNATTKPATTSQGRPVSSPSPTPSPFRYGSDKVRGVNLWVIVVLPDWYVLIGMKWWMASIGGILLLFIFYRLIPDI